MLRATCMQLKRVQMRAVYHWMFIRASSWSSKEVRSKFIKYFEDQGHLIYPSSSVIPKKGDGTYFTNSGMNQFKPLFLGQCDPSSRLWDLKRAANSQKCIRVGGKHNDLEDVGHDLTHHTFFEMLGSWSFGDYFKKEACQMAYEFLTQHLLLPDDRLYFTYFGGDPAMGLAADEECLDIWASLGIPRERILPFGTKDNFWDMGATGPCGPCTEIHYDHKGGGRNAGLEVNNESPDVVEIWNLVFMQFNRHIDQSLSPLPNHHVDTGMGLERMVAVKNGLSDNYRTDLFTPLFDIIQQVTKCNPYQGQLTPNDTAYRILADHSRMLAVAISDGVLPSNDNLGYKVKIILQKCIQLCHRHFHTDPHILLPAVAQGVIASLGEAYPELVENQGKVIDVMSSAIDHHDRAVEQATLSFNKMMSRVKPTNVLSGVAISTLEKGQFGSAMSLDTITQLAEQHGMTLDMEHYRQHVQQESSSKSHSSPVTVSRQPVEEFVDRLIQQGKPVTDDDFKYSFSTPNGMCDFSVMAAQTSPCSIEGMLVYDQEEATQSHMEEGQKGEIVLDKTCFYAEAGGQEADKGFLHSQTGVFQVEDVHNLRGYVVHSGHMTQGRLHLGQNVAPEISVNHREGNMRNHTGTHLVNSALMDVLPTTQQEGSNINHHRFTFDFLALSKLDDVEAVETKVKEIIKGGHPVTCREMTFTEAKVNQGIGWNRKEEYPDHVRVVGIGSPSTPESGELISMELCGGTHVLNTADVGDFCITGLNSQSQHVQRVTCVTGPQAVQANSNGEVLESLCSFLRELHAFILGHTDSNTAVNATQDIVSRVQQLKESSLQSVLVDCVDDFSSSKKDVDMIVSILDSLLDELQPLLDYPLTTADCANVMKQLLRYLHQCQHLGLLPKRTRHTIHECLQDLEHKVQTLVNAKMADTLKQVLLKMEDEGKKNEPNFITVDPEMNPRQVAKVVTRQALQRPLVIAQEGRQDWALTMSIPWGQGKPKPGDDVVSLLSLLQDVGNAKGKVVSKDGSRFVVKGSVKGCEVSDIEACVRRWWGER